MKTVVVMQPYFFPYLGYFQLVAASSVFVFLDDVTFIKGGWINRNRFFVQGRAHTFSVPIRAASSHRPIHATVLAEDRDWRKQLLALLKQAYAHAPYRAETLALVEGVVTAPHSSIGTLAADSVRAVCKHVGLTAVWRQTSLEQTANGLKGAERIIEICRSLGATRYVNAPGGKELYDRQQFSRAGIELNFLSPSLPPYTQTANEFINGLSIIDVLMFNPPDRVLTWMENYEVD